MAETILAGVAVLAAWVAALVGGVLRRGGASAPVAAVLTGLGFLTTLGVVALATTQGTEPVVLGSGAWVVRVDAIAVTLMLLVLGLSAVIQSFAVRYLRGDLRQRWFVVTANLLTGATVLMVAADTVVVFALGWVAAGISLVLLLATYWPEPQAQVGVRRTAWRFAIGDVALLIATVVLLARGGVDLPLADVGVVMGDAPPVLALMVGLLLVLAALARSSQIPFQGWLPVTLAAPTPVSALLHAGVVNAGAILLIRFSPAVGESTLLMAVVFTAGAATLVYASAVRLVRPDVKGRLVFSTMAQMGFMIMACGLGAFAAALFHLVAHGLYKSALFLSAGTGVRQAAIRRAWPMVAARSRGTVVVAVILALLIPVAAVAAARSLFAPEISPASMALLAFVILTGVVTVGATLITRVSGATVLISFVTITVLTLAYTGFVAAFDTLVAPIPAPGAVNPWWVLVPGVGLLLLQGIVSTRHRPTALTASLYAHAMTAATPRMLPVKGI